jgi:nucleoside-triphosphatase
MGEPWFLVTGQPGCGKTTLIKALIARLEKEGCSLSGFITLEHLSGGKRDGFDIVTYPGPSARMKFSSKVKTKTNACHKTGAYFVDVGNLDSAALPSICPGNSGVDMIVIDEIGRMEMHSEKFKTQVSHLRDENQPLFGSIAAPRYGHVVPFCEELKKDSRVKVFHLKASNRDEILLKMESSILKWWKEKKDFGEGEYKRERERTSDSRKRKTRKLEN